MGRREKELFSRFMVLPQHSRYWLQGLGVLSAPQGPVLPTPSPAEQAAERSEKMQSHAPWVKAREQPLFGALSGWLPSVIPIPAPALRSPSSKLLGAHRSCGLQLPIPGLLLSSFFSCTFPFTFSLLRPVKSNSITAPV